MVTAGPQVSLSVRFRLCFLPYYYSHYDYSTLNYIR
jgi:hypothetical protein